MNKKRMLIGSSIALCILLAIASLNFRKVIKIDIFERKITKQEYLIRKGMAEAELTRIMTDGFYSKNKIEDLKNLKEKLVELKRRGAIYE